MKTFNLIQYRNDGSIRRKRITMSLFPATCLNLWWSICRPDLPVFVQAQYG